MTLAYATGGNVNAPVKNTRLTAKKRYFIPAVFATILSFASAFIMGTDAAYPLIKITATTFSSNTAFELTGPTLLLLFVFVLILNIAAALLLKAAGNGDSRLKTFGILLLISIMPFLLGAVPNKTYEELAPGKWAAKQYHVAHLEVPEDAGPFAAVNADNKTLLFERTDTNTGYKLTYIGSK